jgi:hypothetical protein
VEKLVDRGGGSKRIVLAGQQDRVVERLAGEEMVDRVHRCANKLEPAPVRAIPVQKMHTWKLLRSSQELTVVLAVHDPIHVHHNRIVYGCDAPE